MCENIIIQRTFQLYVCMHVCIYQTTLKKICLKRIYESYIYITSYEFYNQIFDFDVKDRKMMESIQSLQNLIFLYQVCLFDPVFNS